MGSPGASRSMSHGPLGRYPDCIRQFSNAFSMSPSRGSSGRAAENPALTITVRGNGVLGRRQADSQPAATGWRRLADACGLTFDGFGRRNGRWRSKTASISSGGHFIDAAPTPRNSSLVASSSGTSLWFARFNHSSSFSRLSNSASRRRRSVRIKELLTPLGNLGNPRPKSHRQGWEGRCIGPGFQARARNRR
jgi:hypothetical protein